MNVTDNRSTDREFVRGEMQPWTDYSGGRAPASGSVLAALLADLLPQSKRALVVGPHGSDLIDAVAARSAQTTVLVRSVGDAESLRAVISNTTVTIVAGSLDGLIDSLTEDETYDLVLAADGLDRVMGYDAPQQDWHTRAAALVRAAAAGAMVVVGMQNDFALTELFDSRPSHKRHGDDEWWPLHDDPTRPASPAQLRDALTGLGLETSLLWATVDVAGETHTLVEVDALAATRPGRPAARIAVRAFETAATAVPLLASLAEGVNAAACAGQLGAVTPGWLVVCGPRPPAVHTIYTRGGNTSSVLAADLADNRWKLVTVAGAGSSPAGLSANESPAEVPDTESVERLLLRAAAKEDVPEFRRLAEQLGDWVGKSAAEFGPGAVICLDDTGVDGDTFARGVLARQTAEESDTAELLAAAWHRFADRLTRGHHRHPWPPWMSGADLVRTWLSMSGEEPTDAILDRGRQIAEAVAVVMDAPQVATPSPDLRTQLVDAETARTQAVELAGHVFGLERTLKMRDQQLKVREGRLRSLRSEMSRFRGSRAARLAVVIRKVGVVRDPKRLARAVKRRLPGH